jgi:hypothetical protein
MGLEAPIDNIGTVLTKGAMKLNKVQKIRSFEGNYTADKTIHNVIVNFM